MRLLITTISVVLAGSLVCDGAACVPIEREGSKEKRRGATSQGTSKASKASKGGKGSVTTAVPKRAAKRTKPAASADDASQDPLLEATFTDAFERVALGPDWQATANTWQIQDGRLCVVNAHNHPAWLKRRIPTNARIEFTAESASADGDIKAEVWGDGRSTPKRSAYRDATSYLIVYGGWRNRFHVLARKDEHSRNRPEVRVQPGGPPNARPVEPGRAYRIKVERTDGKTVKWYVDGVEILSYVDASPLTGPGHDHFAFNDWTTPVCFDDLKITPLDSNELVRD